MLCTTTLLLIWSDNMQQANKAPKKKPSLMIRVSQEAANRLEAETLRRSIRGGIVLSRSKVLDDLIMEHFPESTAPLIDSDTEKTGVTDKDDVNQETDSTGKKKP